MESGRTVRLSLGALILVCMTFPEAMSAGRGESVSGSTADAYVLARGAHWSSTNTSLEVARAIQRRFSGDFLWVRRGGKDFLIRDLRVIDEAQSLFAPLRKLDPERSELARHQSRLEAQQAALDREQEEIDRDSDELSEDSSGRGDESARGRLERRKRELEVRMRTLESRERELENVERSIEKREEELERKAERELWSLIDRTIARGLARPAE